MEGPANPYIRVGEPAARPPGDRPFRDWNAIFLQKFIFDLEIYTLPGGRPTAGRQGLLCKTFCSSNCAEVPGAGRPAVGQPALAARLLGDRLSHPYIRVGWSPHPSFASLKFQKLRKKREGGREAKPCRIFEPATASNQNSSTLYK